MNSILLVLLCVITDIGVGGKIDFAGGPIPSVIVSANLKDEMSVNFSAGGFPTRVGPIMRTALNFRYLFKEERKWSPYIQGGSGYTTIWYNKDE